MAAAVKSFVQILSRQWKTREKRADRSFRAAAAVRTYERTNVGRVRTGFSSFDAISSSSSVSSIWVLLPR